MREKMDSNNFYCGLKYKYWILIIINLLLHIWAVILTWVMVSSNAAEECNPFMHLSFSWIGIIVSGIASTLVLLVLMYLFIRHYHNKGKIWLIWVLFFVMTPLMFMDAINDSLVYLKSPNAVYTLGFFRFLYSMMHLSLTCS